MGEDTAERQRQEILIGIRRAARRTAEAILILRVTPRHTSLYALLPCPRAGIDATEAGKETTGTPETATATETVHRALVVADPATATSPAAVRAVRAALGGTDAVQVCISSFVSVVSYSRRPQGPQVR
jgi:hypothetical protein